ncbi:protein kinase [Streptomyces sp. NPDC059070]|uniref:serine/threonine-protein kinase n=1 Tax=unclassified Streptomyces TaxID=2593676 RepID=UPI0034E27CE2
MGEVFAGRYELIDPIGRGGVGAVWRAWDHRRRRCVAAKVLQQSDAHTLLRFVREQALRIDHPHVLAPASWAADDDKVLFTMDLVSGGSLAHLIGDYGPLPPRFVCVLLDQLLAGLAAVHAEGVVHRDIKPANILLEATGTGRPHLRLSDFGIAMRKGEPRLTETNYVMGTPGYFAPEQIMGAEPDFPSDLFAVGLVTLYLLEGQKPDARALVEYFSTHGTPGAPQGVPEPLWQVLAGLLQPDPHIRFRTATGARKALASAVELLPDTGTDEEPVEVFDQIGPLPQGFTPRELPRVLQHPPTPSARTPLPVQHPQPVPHPSAAPNPSPAEQPAQAQAQSYGLNPSSAQSRPQPYGQAPAPAQEQPYGQDPAPAAQGQPWPQEHPWPQEEHGWPQEQQAWQQGHQPWDPSGQRPLLVPQFPTPPTADGFHTPPPPYPSSAPTPVTKRYTARSTQVPTSAPPVSGTSGAPASPGPRASRRRPGPPAKVAVPVLLLALICFAVGFWALSRL